LAGLFGAVFIPVRVLNEAKKKPCLWYQQANRESKASVAGWWAVLRLVFFCKLSQTAIFNRNRAYRFGVDDNGKIFSGWWKYSTADRVSSGCCWR
jgi:hypothetical protein